MSTWSLFFFASHDAQVATVALVVHSKFHLANTQTSARMRKMKNAFKYTSTEVPQLRRLNVV